MDVLEAIKKRRSIRKFNSLKRVSDEQIEKLLDAARWAPSAGNLQSYLFLVVRDQATKDRLSEAAGQKEVSMGSVVFVGCADLRRSASLYRERGRSLYAIQDAALATYALWLTATAMGLGAVWIGAFDEDAVREVLGIAKELRPVVLLPVGYPAESPTPPKRRGVAEISKRV